LYAMIMHPRALVMRREDWPETVSRMFPGRQGWEMWCVYVCVATAAD